MDKRTLQIIQARSYLNMMSIRTNNELHAEHLTNAMYQIIFLEEWRGKVIKLFSEREAIALETQDELRALRLEVSELKTKNTKLEQALEIRETTVENLTEGMIARCDLCGSET